MYKNIIHFMKVKNYSTYSTYSKLYESKLIESRFFSEENISVEDIIKPIEGLITEELIGKWLKDKYQQGKAAVKSVIKGLGDVISRVFNGVVNFFKNFSIKKLISAVSQKIKEIGSGMFQKVKDLLSGFSDFIVRNGLCDENNRPNFKNIWVYLCRSAKNLVDWNKEGFSEDELQQVGNNVRISESANDIGDDEIHHYGMFEKLAYALGIKNARFNGVVSQIVKKGTIGLIIMGILKLAGISLAGVLAGMSPILMAAIGGMLLMAGLIILAIWICKPYPTVEDCLAYLGNYFSNKSKEEYISSDDIEEISNDFEEVIDEKPKVDSQSLKSIYPEMIKNLQSLKSMIISFGGVGLENDDLSKSQGIKSQASKVKSAKMSVVGESIKSFAIFEKEFSKQPRKVTITAAEDYLAQAYKNIQKSMNNIVDQKDKGIGVTEQFIDDILQKKLDSQSKDIIKSLYSDVYEHLYSKYSKTIADFGPLYKESIDIISDKNKRKIVAEKIARLAKRTMQFEGENMYSALGEFGADMKDFNTSLKKIMEYYKQ